MTTPSTRSEVLSAGVEWATLRPPSNVPVVDGSMPVPFFGDPVSARVATIGLNPSSVEFLDDRGHLLGGARRRLATTDSLGSAEAGRLSGAQVEELLQDCRGYFDRNPYRRWFDQLDALIRHSAGASYYDGTAVHLDLSVWATDPPWGRLSGVAQRALLVDGVQTLSRQLRHFGFDIVLLNGRGVADEVMASGLVDLRSVDRVRVGSVTAEIVMGEVSGSRWIGWSTNLQSSFGVSNAFRARLADEIKRLISTVAVEISAAPEALQTKAVPADGYLNSQTVYSKRELFQLLERWLRDSSAPTIADIDSYGGRAWIWIELGGHSVHLNADTKREAVESYVQSNRENPTGPWPVVGNRNGTFNKVLPGPDSTVVSGWYAYLKTPLKQQAVI